MQNDEPSARRVLEALAPKIASSPETLDIQTMTVALYDLKNMKAGAIETRRVLAVLAIKIAAPTNIKHPSCERFITQSTEHERWCVRRTY
jgi:hypothetical protein